MYNPDRREVRMQKLALVNLIENLREYADTAEASGENHWAAAMREAARRLHWPILGDIE